MIALILSFLILALGAQFVLLCNWGESIEINWHSIWQSTIAGICLTSLIAIILLELEGFSIAQVLTFLTVGNFLLIPFSAQLMPKASLTLPLKPRYLILISILATATFFRWPPANYVTGGQDQGIYVNIANHINNNKTVFVHDPLISILESDSELLEIYKNDSYRVIGETSNGTWSGTFVPGLYIQDLPSGTLVPQFYHLHSLWMAISSKTLGRGFTTFSLFGFGILGLIAFYALAMQLFKKEAWALFATALLALNPAHAYFSRLPVTEIVAMFFFITGLEQLLRWNQSSPSHRILSALSFGCFFFTRITGFLIVPIVLLSLAISYSKKPSKQAAIAATSCSTILLGLYLWSFAHGWFFSNVYTVEIFKNNLGLTGNLLPSAIALTTCLAVVFPVTLLAINKLKSLRVATWRVAIRYRKLTSTIITIASFIAIAYLGYRMGFTDEYKGDPWLDLKWHIVGRDWITIRKMNIHVLALFISFAGLWCTILGMLHTFARAPLKNSYLILSIFFLFFFLLLTLKKHSSPNLYYYGRYLVSELLPLAILLCCSGIIFLCSKVQPQLAKLALVGTLSSLMLYQIVPYTWAQAKSTEHLGWYDALNKFDASLPKNAVLLLDMTIVHKNKLVATFRMTFEKPTFIVSKESMNDEKLLRLSNLLKQKGFHPYLLSARRAFKGKAWNKRSYLNSEGKIIVPARLLYHKPGVPLPDRYRGDNWHFGIYSFSALSPQAETTSAEAAPS